MAKTQVGHGQKPQMTDKQRMFVAEYMTNGYNATQAAIKAGYSKKVAQAQGARLIKQPLIARALKKLMGDALHKKGLEREAILEKVSQNLHRNLRDLADEKGIIVSNMNDIPERAYAYIDGFEVRQIFGQDGEVVGQTIKIKLSPNASVQDMAMKFIGAYAPEKHETKHSIDWDALCTPSQEISPMEQKLKAIEAQAQES